MRFDHRWSEPEVSYHQITFTLEELQAASAATGLDVREFRGACVFESTVGEGHHLDEYTLDPKAVAYLQPLVSAALDRKNAAEDRRNTWCRARHQGWQVLDAAGNPVPEPAYPGEDW
ncbi:MULTISPECIES: hypothetical protein [unclassified Methylobacterium]|jgi:hypothetical protein|uniref:hypothetical protein n=1 Tax=unclassified Methylobacterium TaxID=2615210 RepID=UPI001355A5F4|nr:hypothetical protein [Methylobacterium sp. 2A]MWV22420.1 hypothetical protein [Methylobacterium sp. 2A]